MQTEEVAALHHQRANLKIATCLAPKMVTEFDLSSGPHSARQNSFPDDLKPRETLGERIFRQHVLQEDPRNREPAGVANGHFDFDLVAYLADQPAASPCRGQLADQVAGQATAGGHV